MNTVFDIKKMGAMGDGKTDDTAVIQSALDQAAECMGKVIVPPGRYLTKKLNMHGQGVSMEGSSAWSYRSDGSSIIVLADDSADCLIDITGAFGCAIKGICMDGNGLGDANKKPIHGVKLYWDKYNGGSEEDTPMIDDCRIGNFSGDGVHLEHIWCFSVRHSMLHNNGRNGLFIDGWDGFVLDNWFSYNKGWGLKGGNVVASITATGNRVEWNYAGGFGIEFGDSYNFTGNFFDRSHGPSIELGGKKGVSLVSITGNIFRRSGAYLDVMPEDEKRCHMNLKNCSDLTCMGNTMRVGKNDGGGGVLSPDFGMMISGCNGCIVKDNTMIKGALKGLVITSDNTDCIIEENIGSLADENWSTGSVLLN